MTPKFEEETNKDFKEFMQTDSVTPPFILQENIFSIVHKDLNPSVWYVFSKMSLIHLSAGIVTLSLCPQFGFRFFGEGPGLMRFFSHLGTYACTSLCGAFFVGTSLFVSGFVLRPEELKSLRNHRWLQVSTLTFLSLGAFIMLDTKILFAFAASWLVGSILGGVAMLELGRILKLYLRRLKYT
jgi:hypothetical protein